jgi:hypothetical protein
LVFRGSRASSLHENTVAMKVKSSILYIFFMALSN